MPTKTSRRAAAARRTKSPFRVHPPGTPESRRSLSRALAYRNRHVVNRFLAEYPMPRKDAEEIFRELKRWLWLSGQADERQSLAITTPIAIVDAMWHTFILFTIDYAKFCHAYHGGMCHHRPANARRRRARAAEDTRGSRGGVDRLGAQMRAQYEVIAQYLGRKTLEKWYVDFAKRYTPRVMAKLKRQGLRGA